ncbi:MAG: hypothetical protein KatS3mg082_3168 [Nitrospiraceae bacterium]|nr:MAG: hypothetical protein KatS3mg082_3168 [Nitrospiraceae bacterium]
MSELRHPGISSVVATRTGDVLAAAVPPIDRTFVSVGERYRKRSACAAVLGGGAVLVTLGGVWSALHGGSLLSIGGFGLAVIALASAACAFLTSHVQSFCPSCKTLITSRKPWTCRSCGGQHDPRQGGSVMFSGCPTCRVRPPAFQCTECGALLVIDPDATREDVTNRFAVEAGRTPMSAADLEHVDSSRS